MNDSLRRDARTEPDDSDAARLLGLLRHPEIRAEVARALQSDIEALVDERVAALGTRFNWVAGAIGAVLGAAFGWLAQSMLKVVPFTLRVGEADYPLSLAVKEMWPFGVTWIGACALFLGTTCGIIWRRAVRPGSVRQLAVERPTRHHEPAGRGEPAGREERAGPEARR